MPSISYINYFYSGYYLYRVKNACGFMCSRRWRTLALLGPNRNNTNKLCNALAVNYKRYDLFIGNILTKPNASNTLDDWLRLWLWRSTVGGLDSFVAAPIFTVPHWWTCTTFCLPILLKFFLLLILFEAIFITSLRICNLFNDSLRAWADEFFYELWEFRARSLASIFLFFLFFLPHTQSPYMW